MSEIIGNQRNIRIARLLGKLRVSHLDGGMYYDGEDYEHDLNAIHAAEESSTIFKSWRDTDAWMNNLQRVCTLKRPAYSSPDWALVLRADAAQRAEALERTLEGDL